MALEHPDAVRISRALKARRVVGDFRAPNIIRLAPVALYNSYVDIWRTAETLKHILDADEHERFNADRGSVA